MASTSSEHGTLEHAGPAISPEHYPSYSEKANTVTPLYSVELYVGSTIILLSMCMLGLPITATSYALEETSSVGMGLAITAAVLNVVVFVAGLVLCMMGFRRHRREDAH